MRRNWIFAVGTAVIFFGVATMSSFVKVGKVDSDTVDAYSSWLCAALVGTMAAVLYREEVFASVGKERRRHFIMEGLLFSALFILTGMVGSLLLYLFSASQITENEALIHTDYEILPPLLILSEYVLAFPIFEEVMIHYVIQGGITSLKWRYSKYIGIVTAIAVAICGHAGLSIELIAYLPTAILSAMYYDRTKNIQVLIIAHCCNNLLAFCLYSL